MKVKRGVGSSLRKKPTFWVTITVFHVSNECRNSILMICHYPDMGMLLICCAASEIALTNQNHYTNLVSEMPSV